MLVKGLDLPAQRLISFVIAMALVIVPVSTAAQIDMTVDVTALVTCEKANLKATVKGGTGPYILTWHFGDTETQQDTEVDELDFPFDVTHEYPQPGEFALELSAMDSQGTMARTGETIFIDGPSVTLTSDPFPPLVILDNGQATVKFTALVEGGFGAYTFVWDLDGDGQTDSTKVNGTSFTYTEAGKYRATVHVTDECGLTGKDTLPVVVIDPNEEACHPMAQRIADGVNTLYPWQADGLYTCEDIFDIFRGELTGSQVGFGRMWHAYHLAQTIQDLTWEEIRDWHLDGNGWGGLVQLNRFADLLEKQGISDLVELVMSGDATIGEIRHSVRSVLRYEAEFEDALARLGDGMSPGELGRFYKTAQTLELQPAQLDEYLESGHSLQELTHAARLGERSDSDWTQIAEAHAAGSSWGEIGQAQRMADGEDWMSVLEAGIRETRELTREENRTERDQERIDRTAAQLGARYGISAQEVLVLYDGTCEQDWGCVRKELRDQVQSSETVSDQDQKTAARLAGQYGVTESKVWSLYDGSCGGSWSCVRAELRAESGRGGGPKPKD